MTYFDDPVTVDTEYGPITVTAALLDVWNTHGWPEDRVLRAMADDEYYEPGTIFDDGIAREP